MVQTATKERWGLWVAGLIALVAVLLVACGGTAPAAPGATSAPVATKALGQPAAAPQATPTPTKVVKVRNKVIVVTEAEPASVGARSEGCSGEIHSMACAELTVDPIGWLDSKTFEPVLLSGFTKWEQMAPNRWRYTLRPGVKFHNGEPWNAEAARVNIDYNGIAINPGTGYSYTGPMKGELVPGEDLKIDVVCGRPCPIFPRTGIFVRIVAPKWEAAASQEEKSKDTVGFGPYKIIGWRPGVDTQFEIYKDYVPSEAYDGQRPTIQYITHVYRPEATVRVAMLSTGEADWAADIGFESKGRVPQWRQSTTTEVYTLVLDLMWHPELKKQKVRLALAHAIDCQGLLDSLFAGQQKCHAAISPPGSVGVTPENSKPREYNTTLARQLLKEAGYDPKNEINVNTRPGSNIRGLEIMEAVVTYWRAVGVTSKLNSWGDLAQARNIQLSGCGQFGQDAEFKKNLDCAKRSPPGPYFANSHAYEVATSDEILDTQRQSYARMSCFGRSSRVCFPELEKKINIAAGTSAGPERTRLMAELLNISYEEVFFIPLFAVQYVYGLSKDVTWEPNYSPRFRGNTMHFVK